MPNSVYTDKYTVLYLASISQFKTLVALTFDLRVYFTGSLHSIENRNKFYQNCLAKSKGYLNN
jgi:hypothetical protein